jgi:hypothetical protein
MARQSGNTMKVDIAIPLDIFNIVMKLAEDSGAPIHHRSNQRVLSPTIIHLIGLGIQSLKDKPELLTASVPVSDSRLTALSDRVGKLEDSLKDRFTIDQVIEIARDEAHKATQPIFDNVLEIRTQLSTVTPKPVANSGTDDRIEFISFAQTHNLNIKRGDSAGTIRKALTDAGLDGKYRYDSTVRAFYPQPL